MPHGCAFPTAGLSLFFLLMICTAPVSSFRFRLHTKPGMHTTSTAPDVGTADSAPVNLTVCTFATSGSLHDLQATSARFGVHLNVISLGSENLEPHKGIFNKKLRAILSVANELSPDAVMVAVDAFDVLIGRPIGRLLLDPAPRYETYLFQQGKLNSPNFCCRRYVLVLSRSDGSPQ